mmetsp:Transcript_43394/g.77951  ORF Transcript_43394/g.77951 Transcript_43394/m.77951 type:complete len:231 (+) Transcript_43394:153-845(+)
MQACKLEPSVTQDKDIPYQCAPHSPSGTPIPILTCTMLLITPHLHWLPPCGHYLRLHHPLRQPLLLHCLQLHHLQPSGHHLPLALPHCHHGPPLAPVALPPLARPLQLPLAPLAPLPPCLEMLPHHAHCPHPAQPAPHCHHEAPLPLLLQKPPARTVGGSLLLHHHGPSQAFFQSQLVVEERRYLGSPALGSGARPLCPFLCPRHPCPSPCPSLCLQWAAASRWSSVAHQ